MKNKKHSVLHLVSNLGIGGAQAVIANTCNEMNRQDGWISYILPLEDDRTMLPRFDAGTMILEPVEHRRRYYLRSLFRICRVLRKIKPDVLHLHLWLPKLLGSKCGTLCRVPLIVTTEHSGYPWTEPGRIRSDRRISRYIDRRIMVCNYIEGLFVEQRVCSKDQATVLYNPVPEPEASTAVSREAAKEMLKLPEDTIVFLFVGALRKVKNLRRLLTSFAQYLKLANSPKSHLMIVGDGPEQDDLNKLASMLEISSRISFEPSSMSLEKYYSAADVFVMTSDVEGFSIALAEAMLRGVVPICTNSGGTPELVIDQETGLLLDIDQPDMDPGVFAKAATSQKLREALGEGARSHAGRLTSPAAYISGLLNIYAGGK